jgi:hypothetical protein
MGRVFQFSLMVAYFFGFLIFTDWVLNNVIENDLQV